MKTGWKRKIVNKELTIGSWMSLGHVGIAEIMAQAGFEWITIDLEHSAIDFEAAFRLIQTLDGAGCIPMVRVSENSSTIIKRVMDAGAGGVIVPMVNSREEAEAAVAAVKYPPVGSRGVGLSRAQKYGHGFAEYQKWVEAESVVIVQIENIKAIENLESILSVPGVDGSIIGPYDLSASLGIPGQFSRPEVVEALDRYEKICDQMGKPKGYHIVNPDETPVVSYINKGYSFLAVGVDFLYLGVKCRQTLSTIAADCKRV